ncbi:MAG: T9SS type A sorting domain-containing protein [Fibrobacteres bacterium]|nr:T9SS type A sorting domain-containing protein [Fibrobacterota bacterium]
MKKMILLLLLTVAISFATTALPFKVMVQVNDTALFGPVFNGLTDTSATKIEPSVVSAPTKGTITLVPDHKGYWMPYPAAAKKRKLVKISWLRYIPNSNVTGIDSFTYSINDGVGTTNIAKCIIRVHPAEPGAMKVLIVVQANIQSKISAEVNRLRDDLSSAGYVPRILPYTYSYVYQDTLTGKNLYDTLVAEYDRTDGMLAGAILIGRLPVSPGLFGDEPFWNMSVWYKRFYMKDSLAFHYADTGNVLQGKDTAFGGYSEHRGYQGNHMRHIWITRITSASSTYGDTVLTIKRALDANHNYRTGLSRFPHRAYQIGGGTEAALREVWPEVTKLPRVGFIVKAPGDTFKQIYTSYQAGNAGSLWDVDQHMNINGINPAPNWLYMHSDSLMNRPNQLRFAMLTGCHVSGFGNFANQHLSTRGGGGVFAVGAVDYISYNGCFSVADSTSDDKRFRKYIAAKEPWGRSWIRSGMPMHVGYFYGDMSLKSDPFPSNAVPLIDTLRKTRPSAGKVRLAVSARDEDGTIALYEWWFSKSYNLGKNEPDTATTVPFIEIDSARCTSLVRIEIVDNYMARCFLNMHKDSTRAILGLQTTAAEKEIEALVELSPLSVNPHPFNPSTTISFNVPKPAEVALKIVDMNGKVVASYSKHYAAKGRGSYLFSAVNGKGERLPSGVYFLALKIGATKYSRSIVLMK